MKICPHPKCGKTHNKPGTYCSRSCANSRVWSTETQAKKRKSMKRYYIENGISKKQLAALNRGRKLTLERHLKRNLETPTELLGWTSIRKKILFEQDGKCNKCGLDEWFGKDLVLEVDHKDGNKHNNKRENLEALCPNCHSQTPTWKGRKRI